MKRLAACFLIVTVAFVFCGCNAAENDRRFMVSSLGFSGTEKRVSVFAEIIVVNSESPEAEPVPTVCKGEGESIAEAFKDIASYLTAPLLLEHCGVIVLQKGITPELFEKICDYCFEEEKITLSAYMILTDSIEKLLDEKPASSVAVGYDIMGLIGQLKENDKEFDNRFFELEAERKRGKTEFKLPYILRNEGGIFLNGKALIFSAEASK